MFYYCSSLEEVDVSKFIVSRVETIFSMFAGCSSLESLDVSNWDTSSVTNMHLTFEGCSSLAEFDGSKWDTSKVTIMISMFNSCTSLMMLDLSGFDITGITQHNLDTMLLSAGAGEGAHIILGDKFSTAAVDPSNKYAMEISGSGFSKITLTDSTIIQQHAYDNPPTPNGTWCLEDYSNAQGPRSLRLSELLTEGNHGGTWVWDMSDHTGGANSLDWGEAQVAAASEPALTFAAPRNAAVPAAETPSYYTLSAADAALGVYAKLDKTTGNLNIFRSATAPCTFGSQTRVVDGNVVWYDLNPHEAGKARWDWTNDAEDTISVTMSGGFKPKNLSGMFYNVDSDYELTSADLSLLDTSAATEASYMFQGCSKLSTITGTEKWDTRNITSFSQMFEGCKALTKVDVSNWDVSKSESFKYMLYHCSSLKEFVAPNWNMLNALNTYWMFYGCTSLEKVILTNCTSPKLENTIQMFYNCTSLKYIDLHNLDLVDGSMKNPTSDDSMFGNCTSLETLDVSNFYQGDPEMGPFPFTNNITKLSKISLDGFFCYGDLPSVPKEAPYTGYWVREDGTTDQRLTSEELFSLSPNRKGTWIWEKEIVEYTLKFDGNGGSGYIDDQKGIPEEQMTVANSFVNFGYTFAGFKDENGELFDADVDGNVVIPANTYQANTTHTLTAQWAPVDTSLDIIDNTVTFTLHAGEPLPSTTCLPMWLTSCGRKPRMAGGWSAPPIPAVRSCPMR